MALEAKVASAEAAAAAAEAKLGIRMDFGGCFQRVDQAVPPTHILKKWYGIGIRMNQRNLGGIELDTPQILGIFVGQEFDWQHPLA